MSNSQSATVEASEAASGTPGTGTAAGSDRRLAIGTQENITRKLLLCFRELAKSIDSIERRTAKTENKHGDYSRSTASLEQRADNNDQQHAKLSESTAALERRADNNDQQRAKLSESMAALEEWATHTGTERAKLAESIATLEKCIGELEQENTRLREHVSRPQKDMNRKLGKNQSHLAGCLEAASKLNGLSQKTEAKRKEIESYESRFPPPVITENKANQTAPPDASVTPVPEASTPNPDGGRFNHIMEGFKRALWRDSDKVPSEEEPKVEIDRNRVEQVLINLLLNAIHAMPDGGLLNVRSYAGELSSSGTRVLRTTGNHFSNGKTAVVVEIDDTGEGIPDDISDRIFDPFFTTRRETGGTELGLSVVKTIMDLHHARIDICNKNGGGGARATVVFNAREKQKTQRTEKTS